jgi:oligosaccharide repeat unit polymerase
MLIYAKCRLSFRLKVALIFSAAVVIISSVFLGKRQLLIIVAMIVFVHFYFKYASKKNKKIKLVTYMFLSAIGLTITTGVISDLRNNLSNDESNYFSTGALEIISYLSFPLINFEAQFSISGFVGEFRQISPVVSQLIPYKLLGNASFFVQEAPAPEPTIGSGTVGILHWNLGIFMIPVIYFLYGKIASKWYRSAITNPECRSAYGLMLWSIISSHTYIHIFSLAFFWAPALTILFLNKTLNLLNDRRSFGRGNKYVVPESIDAIR